MSELATDLADTRASGGEEAPATEEVIRVAAFRSALRSFLRTSEEIARTNGLTPRRHQLLLMIKGAPDGSERATIGELVQRLQLAQTTVTELVQRAVGAGLLVRERSADDARVICLGLSAEGERRLARVFRSSEGEREKLREILAGLELDTQRPTRKRETGR